MCRGSITSDRHGKSSLPSDTPKRTSAFTARRLTPSTFLIIEVDDVYDEHPFIYAKLVPAASTIVLVDTGCGGKTREPDIELTDVRKFIEVAPIEDNDGRPLNEGGALHYVVVLTHCHYDHILGVEQFAGHSPILVSGYDPTFITSKNLPTHSLCECLGISTPTYTPSLRPHLQKLRSEDGTPLALTLLHTPGHTPDELALWDEEEAMLYVGDTLYEWAHIIFPNEGSIVQWLATVDELASLVSTSGNAGKARISCGHRTAGGPALEVLRTARSFMVDVIEGRELVRQRMVRRGEVHVEYVQEGGRYSLVCPERLLGEARSVGC